MGHCYSRLLHCLRNQPSRPVQCDGGGIIRRLGKVKYFEGTPIPTSVVIVALLGVAFYVNAIHEGLWFGAYKLGPATLHPLTLLYALSGSAMISATLRIPKP